MPFGWNGEREGGTAKRRFKAHSKVAFSEKQQPA
jgi:hypothetical protein